MARRTHKGFVALISQRFASLSWQIRSFYGVVIIISCIIAVHAAILPAKVVMGRLNPVLAKRISANPKADLKLLTIEGVQDPKKFGSEALKSAALAQLRADPLDASAMRSLALYYKTNNDDKRSSELAKLALAISRRDAFAQILVAQDAAVAGDNARAMRHFATALNTMDGGRETIFQALAAQPNQSGIMTELSVLANDSTNWMDEFILYFARNTPDGTSNSAKMLLAGDPRENSRLTKKVGKDLLILLLVRKNYDLIEPLFQRMRGKGADISTDARMSKATVDQRFGPMSWTPAEEVSIGSSLTKIGKNGIGATIFASRRGQGVALYRMLALAPGNYRLKETRRKIVMSDDAKAYWVMKCLNSSDEKIIWSSKQDGLTFSDMVLPGPSVPTGCPLQMLELNVDGGNSATGLEYVIEKFDLVT